jgi:hypothetical protein
MKGESYSTLMRYAILIDVPASQYPSAVIHFIVAISASFTNLLSCYAFGCHSLFWTYSIPSFPFSMFPFSSVGMRTEEKCTASLLLTTFDFVITTIT